MIRCSWLFVSTGVLINPRVFSGVLPLRIPLLSSQRTGRLFASAFCIIHSFVLLQEFCSLFPPSNCLEGTFIQYHSIFQGRKLSTSSYFLFLYCLNDFFLSLCQWIFYIIVHQGCNPMFICSKVTHVEYIDNTWLSISMHRITTLNVSCHFGKILYHNLVLHFLLRDWFDHNSSLAERMVL